VKITLAQINTRVGDLSGNVELCLRALEKARAQGGDLVVFPEMAIPGYPPRDILFDPSFTQAVFAANKDLARRCKRFPPAIIGTILPASEHPPFHPGLINTAILVKDGELHVVAQKQLLPGYDVYYEPRWFVPGMQLPPIQIQDTSVGVLICEDLWDEGYSIHPPAELISAGADLLVCLSASPYRVASWEKRVYQARRHPRPVIYLNLVGANDELIFDGQSFVTGKAGEVIQKLPAFREAIHTVDIHHPEEPLSSLDQQDEIFQALVLGVRDFFQKNDIPSAFISLSGGVDSSVVAVIVTEALGSERVTGVAIPSRYSDPRSTDCARELAENLGIKFEVVLLEEMHAAAEKTLENLLSAEGKTTAENIQARLRMIVMMGFVNRYGGLFINSSNKTELTVGYSTVYGDMSGTLCPIADLTKPEVYALARWINRENQVIPAFVIERPPSAELRPGQVDPFNYDEISPVLEDLVLANKSNPAMRFAEHKRWQMGVILKVSEKAFGTGRMIPITRK